MSPENTAQAQSMASVVNRALILEYKVKKLELEKAILMDVVHEAKKFIKQTNDLGHHLLGLKNMLDKAEKVIDGKVHG